MGMHCAKAEVLRYLGHRRQALSPQLDALVDDCLVQLRQAAKPRCAVQTLAIEVQPGGVLLTESGILLPGQDLARHLSACRQAALMAVTLGVEADSLIRRTETTDLTASLVLDACATQYVEETCDQLEAELRQNAGDLSLTSRFSPGYGDLPLTVQPQLLALLNAQRSIGLTCTDRFILLPRKSVTALIGFSDQPQAKTSPCLLCARQADCQYAKEATACECS